MNSQEIEKAAEKWAEDNCEYIRDVKEYNTSNDLQRGFLAGASLTATPSAPGAGVGHKPTRYTTGPSLYTKEYASEANNMIGGVKQLLKAKIAKLERTKYEDLSDSSDATLKAYKEILSLLDPKEKNTTPRDVPDMGREEAAEKLYPYVENHDGDEACKLFNQRMHCKREGFLAGADWQSCSASQPGSAGVWRKASDRMPANSGVQNAVLIRLNNKQWAGYAFKNYDTTSAKFYYNDGAQSYLTTDCEWLDETSNQQGLVEALEEIRRAVADYIKSEGCSCCQDVEGHKEAKERIAKLLQVPLYTDGSGWDFNPYESKNAKQ